MARPVSQRIDASGLPDARGYRLMSIGVLRGGSTFGGGVIGNTTGSGPVIGGSSPPPRACTPAQDLRAIRGDQPPSSSGLGHHPLKVAARVRIPLGVPAQKPLAGRRNRRQVKGFGDFRPAVVVTRCHCPYRSITARSAPFVPSLCQPRAPGRTQARTPAPPGRLRSTSHPVELAYNLHAWSAASRLGNCSSLWRPDRLGQCRCISNGMGLDAS